jgi:ABC-type glycerol-3-phosphate transport system permease component
VLSVVWIVVGYFVTLHLVYDDVYESFNRCNELSVRIHPWTCFNHMERNIANAREQTLIVASLVMLAPVLIAWLLAYEIVTLVRWIRRGLRDGRPLG